jgi:CheY-like chemotaxis protein
MRETGYILIAEDDEDDQLLIVSAFRDISSRFQITFVNNGLEVLDHFRKYDEGQVTQLPQLLILDLNMPRKTGREALSELRTKPYFSEFPTVIFSTTGNEYERLSCKELGVRDYFVKPVSYSSLTSIVEYFEGVAAREKV